jgi:hypothetical protein
MTAKLADPYVFLQSLVSKKGKSDLSGVYLTAINVVASATEEYAYSVDQTQVDHAVAQLLIREEQDWNRLLVAVRTKQEELVFPISFLLGMDPVSVYFISEGHEMSAHVMIPQVVVEEFPYDVKFFQTLLARVAAFGGKIPVSVRFFIGVATVDWDDMVSRGEAQEIEIEY